MSAIASNSPAGADLREVRERLAVTAAMSERRNSPRHLLFLALFLLLVSIVVLFWSMRSRQSAGAGLDAATAEAARVRQLVAEYGTLKAAGADTTKSRLNEPLTSFYSRIEAAATRAGVKDRIPSARPQGDTRDARTGAVQKRIRYERVQDPDLSALVRWMQYACEDVAGLEVYSLKVQPLVGTPNWQVEVTFSRWERPNR
jgi:type II secretory pathway component PulM